MKVSIILDATFLENMTRKVTKGVTARRDAQGDRILYYVAEKVTSGSVREVGPRHFYSEGDVIGEDAAEQMAMFDANFPRKQ